MSFRHRAGWRAPLCAAVAIVANRAIDPGVPILKRGLLDESAHLASTALALQATGAHDRRFVAAALTGGLLIDVDHVPEAVFGWRGLKEGSPRPYPHSLVTIVTVLVLARALPARFRSALDGLRFGLLTHFLRDATDGTGGLPLLWPLSGRGISLPAAINTPMILAALLWSRRAEAGRARASSSELSE